MTVIDRFEGNIAVIEEGGHKREIPRELLPENASEGDVIIISESGITLDHEAAKARGKSLFMRLTKLMGGRK